MRALCWHGKEKVQVDTVPDPSILNPRDAVIRITSTAICGSDLHLYNGFVKTMEQGDILGHEFMGEVVETGGEVKTCGRAIAWWCRSRFPAANAFTANRTSGRCVTTRIRTRGFPRKPTDRAARLCMDIPI